MSQALYDSILEITKQVGRVQGIYSRESPVEMSSTGRSALRRYSYRLEDNFDLQKSNVSQLLISIGFTHRVRNDLLPFSLGDVISNPQDYFSAYLVQLNLPQKVAHLDLEQAMYDETKYGFRSMLSLSLKGSQTGLVKDFRKHVLVPTVQNIGYATNTLAQILITHTGEHANQPTTSKQSLFTHSQPMISIDQLLRILVPPRRDVLKPRAVQA